MAAPAPVPIKRAPKEFLEVYSLYRERVHQEDQLINQRMGWLLWSNAILLTFFAAVIGLLNGQNSSPQIIRELKAVPDVIIAFGIICTSAAIFSLYAAFAEINYLKEIYDERYPDIVDAEKRGLLPSIVGHRRHHILGLVVPWIIPVCIGSLWLILALFLHFQAIPRGPA